MTEILKSPSFPNGLPPSRSEDEVRAARQASLEVRHTGGPWQIESRSRRPGWAELGHEISYGVNSYGDGPEGTVCRTSGASDADARLIAAAPELLEACREALNWMEPDSYSPNAAKARAMVLAAITKAEGRLP